MRYAISYVSTAAKELTEQTIEATLNFSKNWNNDNKITGMLLFSEGNFFQVLEGDQKTLQDLFGRIQNDKRHYDIIKIFEKEVAEHAFDTYEVDFISMDARYDQNDMPAYFSQIKSLNPAIQTSVNYILQKFTEGIK